MFANRNFFAWVLTLSILLALVLPILVQEGMFMDGMLYAAVSKNLSHGAGSFWFPHYSPTLYSFFNQQPPLGFGIQSVFFKVLGDGFYVERVYSLLCALLNAYLMARLWKVFFGNRPEMKDLAWLPVLLWIIIPVCFWSFSNNMLENTMSVFDLLAMIFLAKYLLVRQSILFLVAAGVFVFLASLTKGVQGTFPVAALFLGWLIYRPFSFKKMTGASLLVLLVPAAIYSLLMLNSNAYNSLSAYFAQRVLNSIKNVSEVESRFYLVGRLAQEILLSLLLAISIMVLSYKKMKAKGRIIPFGKHFWFLLLTGISGSFPLMITLEQRGFYLTTSLPYFAMALAVLAVPGLTTLFKNISLSKNLLRILNACSVLLLLLVLIFSISQSGKFFRDKEILQDVKLIGNAVPPGTVLGSTREHWLNYSLQEYLVRYFYVFQDETIKPSQKYILATGEHEIPSEIVVKKIEIPTKKYHLYQNIGLKKPKQSSRP